MIRVFIALTLVLTGPSLVIGDERTDESTQFEVKSLKELVKQVKALEEYSDNEFILDEKTVQLDKSVQRFQGVQIAWELIVQQVRRQAVYLQPVAKSPAQIYFIKELSEEASDRQLSELVAVVRQQQTKRQLFHTYPMFKIGSTVDVELARRLRHGDNVEVRGEVARIGVRGGRLVVLVSKSKLVGTSESKPVTDQPNAPPGDGEANIKSSVRSALE